MKQTKTAPQKTTFTLHQSKVPPFQEMAETWGWALDVGGTSNLATEDTDFYVLTWFIPADEKELFLSQIPALFQAIEEEIPALTWEETREENWQEKALADFPPIEIGPFFITRNDEPVPTDKIGMKVPAAMAFGSGEHATTTGCLHLFKDILAANNTFSHGLDMGAGSGILSLAATKLFEQKTGRKLPFLCVDNDQPSVEICAENAELNGEEAAITSIFGEGFTADVSAQAQNKAPYPLIFANILMQPLIDMAPDLMNVLDNGGIAILSGFLQPQVKHIQKAYGELEEIARYDNGDWCALAFIKKN